MSELDKAIAYSQKEIDKLRTENKNMKTNCKEFIKEKERLAEGWNACGKENMDLKIQLSDEKHEMQCLRNRYIDLQEENTALKQQLDEAVKVIKKIKSFYRINCKSECIKVNETAKQFLKSLKQKEVNG